jgi:predicted peroxiredoxin
LVEDTIQNGVKEAHHVDVMKFFDKKMENTIKNGVKDTKLNNRILDLKVEDAIQEGVKDTIDEKSTLRYIVDDTIQEGVKDTYHFQTEIPNQVEDAIQEGVKHTIDIESRNKFIIEDTIQNGVKHTDYGFDREESYIEDAIENGVKDVRTPGVGDLESTMDFMNENNTLDVQKLLDDVIEDGVKETKENRLLRTINVISTIKNGVKETKESMLESLEQIDHQVTNCEITESINDAIENGVKETKEISNISLMSEIFKVKAKQTIRDGVKELKVWKSNRCEEHGYFEFVDGIPTYTPMIQVKDVIENGVKELQPLPAQDGNRDWGLYYRRKGHKTKPHTEYVKEVIEDPYNHRGRIEGVIRNTDKDGI